MQLKGEFCSITDAAKELGCTTDYVRQLIHAKKIVGKKFSERAWAVESASLKAFSKQKMTTGRPRKNSA
jgi:hypothetical protein